MVSLLKKLSLAFALCLCVVGAGAGTLSVNDSGTWRDIPVVSVNDSGTWRKIRQVAVNDSGTWRLAHNVTYHTVTTGVIGGGNSRGYTSNIVGGAVGSIDDGSTANYIGGGNIYVLSANFISAGSRSFTLTICGGPYTQTGTYSGLHIQKEDGTFAFLATASAGTFINSNGDCTTAGQGPGATWIWATGADQYWTSSGISRDVIIAGS